jgi:peptidoglycan/xylan/chitin deacetylase (PgdA/CDA1 family)
MGTVRKKLRVLRLFLLDFFGVNLLFRYANRNKAIILTYHGVCEENFNLLKDYDERHIPKSVFRKQLKYLKQKKYLFVTMSELVKRLKNKKSLKKLVVLTFDDGFRNIVENAYPIMLETGAKGCFYLVSDLIDKNELLWSDQVELVIRNWKEKKYKFEFKGEEIKYELSTKKMIERTMQDVKKRLRSISNKERIEHMKQFDDSKINQKIEEFSFASWDQIKNLDKNILEIGAHTVTHPNCTKLNSEEEFYNELYKSKRDLQKELGYEIKHFNYPAGSFDSGVMEYVKKYGYLSAVSTIRGFNKKNVDLYKLKRIGVKEDFLLFKSMISGSFFLLKLLNDFFSKKNK